MADVDFQQRLYEYYEELRLTAAIPKEDAGQFQSTSAPSTPREPNPT
jgi:hypothetical protein